jgi:glycosyltransferase involved in cell wall biosynthesis
MKDKTNKPLVSIITPSFNQAEFIEETIKSVLDQDYQNVEYIIVDGGSTDGSVEIIKKYADKLSWWVSEPDDGQSDAINKGIKHSKGEIIAWLNSDDIYLTGTIRKAVSALMDNPDAGLVYANQHSITNDGKVFNTIRYKQYTLVDLLAMQIIGQPTVFMRRSVLEKAGELSSVYNYLMDHHLWIRMLEQARCKYVSEVWASARFHSGAKNVGMAEDFVKDAEAIKHFVEGCSDSRTLIDQNKRYVTAGRQTFSAHYWLDSGKPGKALKSYWKAFINKPGMAIKHWKRIIFSMFELIGFKFLRRWAYKDHE